ncbi:cation:proton antiporter [Candidatus Uabimicrobium sp. HlEnr_7]|uniref:cation:proton antiporter n=1 Tax=Candidatus Uabimicrobium helgolandensis TaxID=3095367 RepID=UPI0035561C7E
MERFTKKIWWILCLVLLLGVIGDFPTTFTELQAQETHGEHKEHDSHAGGHGDEIAPIYLLIFGLIFGAVLGRFIAKMFNQPAVLGELLIGLVIGTFVYQSYQPVMVVMRHNDKVERILGHTIRSNMDLQDAIKKEIPEKDMQEGKYGFVLAKILQRDSFDKYLQMVIALKIFSALGVILLLFMVGLECNFKEMMEVGSSSFWSAIVGIVLPFILGFYVTQFLAPGMDQNVYIFIGATLCATSIGITARVFKDMNKLNIPEAKVVMGAAVIDDILGLIILAVVTGIITTGHIDFTNVSFIILKALLFLFVAIFVIGKFLSKYTYHVILLDRANAKLLFTISLMLLFAWASDALGLASIVGAFAAGLILEDKFFKDVRREQYDSIESAIGPIESLFAPMFFVMMGMLVDVTTFLDPEVIKISLALTVAAIIGKIVAGWAVKKELDSLVVGIGLIPRGEVGLIFASIGKTTGVLDEGMFSAVIVVVMLTTFVAPPALKWAIDRISSTEEKQEIKKEEKQEVKKEEEPEKEEQRKKASKESAPKKSSKKKKKKKKKKK